MLGSRSYDRRAPNSLFGGQLALCAWAVPPFLSRLPFLAFPVAPRSTRPAVVLFVGSILAPHVGSAIRHRLVTLVVLASGSGCGSCVMWDL